MSEGDLVRNLVVHGTPPRLLQGTAHLEGPRLHSDESFGNCRRSFRSIRHGGVRARVPHRACFRSHHSRQLRRRLRSEPGPSRHRLRRQEKHLRRLLQAARHKHSGNSQVQRRFIRHFPSRLQQRLGQARASSTGCSGADVPNGQRAVQSIRNERITNQRADRRTTVGSAASAGARVMRPRSVATNCPSLRRSGTRNLRRPPKPDR